MRHAPSVVSLAMTWIATSALALTSCGGSRAPATASAAPSATPAPKVQAAVDQDCPAGMSGLQIGYSETERGASIVFTIPPPQHQSLQFGAQRMVEADRNEQKARAEAALPNPDAGGARAAGGGLIAPDLEPSPGHSAVTTHGPIPSPGSPEPVPPATIRMIEVPTGAVVAYEAADPAGIKALRDHVKQRVRIMQLGQCPSGMRGQARP